MCRACDAADERQKAAQRLLGACQEQYGLGPALKGVYRPEPLTEAWNDLLRRIAEAADE